jgi:hypothetical protein
MIIVLALLLALLQPTAQDAPGCLKLGDAQTSYSAYFASPHPVYDLYVSTSVDYQLSISGQDLQTGLLPSRDHLVLDGAAGVSMTSAGDDLFRLYLCQGGAQPTWILFPQMTT